MNALADGQVGDYLNEHFVAAFQKVATFRIAGGQKQGGNVASYLCTPDGRVLHLVAGPADAAALLREARWAVEGYKLAQLEGSDDPARLRQFFRDAHAERLRQDHGLDLARGGEHAGRPSLDAKGRAHLLLAAAPLARIEHVYRLVFERILGEQVSAAPVDVAGR